VVSLSLTLLPAVMKAWTWHHVIAPMAAAVSAMVFLLQPLNGYIIRVCQRAAGFGECRLQESLAMGGDRDTIA